MIRDVIHSVAQNVRHAPTQFDARRKAAEQWVRATAWGVREQGEDGLWALNLQALERAGALLDRANAVPGFDAIRPNAEELIATWEKLTTSPPIESYEEQNVRTIIGGLHAVDRLGLLRIRHWEVAHKARKTVLDAVERELERRARYAKAA